MAVDKNYLHRLREFAEVRRAFDARDREINEMRLDRRARREALERSADDRAAAQDRVNAQYPLELKSNASGSYYVWVLRQGSDEPLSSEGPYGPMGLKVAEQNARIGATKGIHDRAVSRGRDPESSSFRIERRYQAKSGRRLI